MCRDTRVPSTRLSVNLEVRWTSSSGPRRSLAGYDDSVPPADLHRRMPALGHDPAAADAPLPPADRAAVRDAVRPHRLRRPPRLRRPRARGEPPRARRVDRQGAHDEVQGAGPRPRRDGRGDRRRAAHPRVGGRGRVPRVRPRARQGALGRQAAELRAVHRPAAAHVPGRPVRPPRPGRPRLHRVAAGDAVVRRRHPPRDLRVAGGDRPGPPPRVPARPRHVLRAAVRAARRRPRRAGRARGGGPARGGAGPPRAGP